MNHTDDCIGGEDCQSIIYGSWDQPPREYVDEAVDELSGRDDIPWCQIRLRAWRIQQREEAMEGV